MSMLSKRGTSLGLGKKYDFSDVLITPGVGEYNLSKSMVGKKPHMLGLGREVIFSVSVYIFI